LTVPAIACPNAPSGVPAIEPTSRAIVHTRTRRPEQKTEGRAEKIASSRPKVIDLRIRTSGEWKKKEDEAAGLSETTFVKRKAG